MHTSTLQHTIHIISLTFQGAGRGSDFSFQNTYESFYRGLYSFLYKVAAAVSCLSSLYARRRLTAYYVIVAAMPFFIKSLATLSVRSLYAI